MNITVDETFNFWTVKEQIDKVFCLCHCKCGTVRRVRYTSIVSNKSKSCGCLRVHKQQAQQLCSSNVLQYYYYLHTTDAKKRNSDPLVLSEWKTMVQKPCNYCGGYDLYSTKYCYKRLKTETLETFAISKNGIDRIDSSKGYSPQNCVPCCYRCNIAKSNQSLEEFTEWLNRVVNYQKKVAINQVCH